MLSAVNTVNLVNTVNAVNAVRNPPPPESNHAQCWSEFGSLTDAPLERDLGFNVKESEFRNRPSNHRTTALADCRSAGLGIDLAGDWNND